MENIDIFVKRLEELSVDKINPVKEWVLTNECLGDTCCLCGHPIKYIAEFENKLTAKKIIAGSICCQKIMCHEINVNELKKQEVMKKNEEKNKSLIEHLYDLNKKVNDVWEKNFINSAVYGIKVYGHLTEGQSKVLNNIEKKFDSSKWDEKLKNEMNIIAQLFIKANAWEKQFLETIQNNKFKGWELSEKQNQIYQNMIFKYKITLMNNNLKTENIEWAKIDFLTPRDWQKDALQKWYNSDKKGIIEAVTGGGKTRLAQMEFALRPTIKTLIVVPTIHLQGQWKEFMIATGISEDKIGFIGNGKHEYDKDYAIAIINSIRNSQLNFQRLIMDEIHRYGSECNINFLYTNTFKEIMGLTATLERQDSMHIKLLQFAPLIYQYTHKDAREEGVVSEYEIINKAVHLTDIEKSLLDEQNLIIKQLFPLYQNDFKLVQASLRDGMAGKLMRAFVKRRQILLNAKQKINVVYDIIKNENSPKTIIFTEYIKTADQIVKILKEKGIKVAKYHSGMHIKERKAMLDEFATNNYDIMVAAKCLDEGMNVPEIELALIIGGSSVQRQMIQRVGRVLRKREGKVAKIYQIYVKGSKDEEWLRKRSFELVKEAVNVKWE